MNTRLTHIIALSCFWGCLLFFHLDVRAQAGSVVVVHADKSSGYGVAFGGVDRIVTSLHIVAGKKVITVDVKGKGVNATIEKVLKSSDLALLKLASPHNLTPLIAYPSEAPYGTPVNYFEALPGNPKIETRTTSLKSRESLEKISSRTTNMPVPLAKALCQDKDQYYPAMTTSVLKFEESNIKKAHSGSPITYQNKLIGMVDGGVKLTDGKICIWAIQALDFKKLLDSGTPGSAPLPICDSPTKVNTFMYSGTRSDNPMLTPEEAEQARAFESASTSTLSFTDPCENLLTLKAELRAPFTEVFESLFEETEQNILDLFSDESENGVDQRLSIDNLASHTMDLYMEDVTGASILIPSESHFNTSRNSFGNFITVSSPLGTTSYSVYISHLDTPEDAEKEMARFKAMCLGMGQPMEPTSNNIKDFRCDSGNPYYKETVENSTLDQNGKLKSEFQATMIINKTDFIGAIVSVSDWNTMWSNPEERLFFYFLEMSGQFADFTIY